MVAAGGRPSVVVRGTGARTEPRRDGPAVVGVDGSPPSPAAIPFVFRTAASRGVPLVAVHRRPDRPLGGLGEIGVAGSRGRGGFRGLRLGSTGHARIHHAACPVAVVPPPRP